MDGRGVHDETRKALWGNDEQTVRTVTNGVNGGFGLVNGGQLVVLDCAQA